MNADVHLSPRCVKACRAYAKHIGLLTPAARELGLAPSTVSTYIERARLRMGFNTRRQLLKHWILREAGVPTA